MQTGSDQEFSRHPLAHANGGLQLVDEGNIIPQAFKDVLSKIALKFTKGEFQNLLKTPGPAYMHYPRTYLEGAAVDLSLAATYLTKAAETTDPVERLKNVLCSYIGGMHINVSQIQCRVPLNPILGETVQRILPTGECFYGE